MNSLKNKHILSLQDLDLNEIISILDFAATLKKESKMDLSRKLLEGKTLGMVFQKPSTRTRVSFEIGMFQLGGHAIYLGINDMQLSKGETIEDTARTLSLYLDCLMARVYDHRDLEKLSKYSSIPIINGLSDLFHPCQILADLLTIREYKKKFNGLKLAWIGDGFNVCNDLLIGCAKTGINITAACPSGYEPPEWIVNISKKEGTKTGSIIKVTNEPIDAVQEADIVATDTFVSLGKDNEKIIRETVFIPKYQVNSELIKHAKDDAIFMHCLPAKRGQEVTSDVIDGKLSVVWKEAENRLHVQKALLCLLIRDN
ncbi:MAG TPA: ornithine carbamoyltransferase [Nitrososphaeraceae archaeon]|jgi:ornithine carbamoyltransferase|nr:ornithine carbamoyltransferase [Nitrososphaeraceae archaeon]